MEFPNLGEHCAHPPCSRLDFLPIKCDFCRSSFCSEHVKAAAHECPRETSKDLRVPVCPLCGNPVPGRRGERPDVAMNLHIENECRNLSNKVYRNRCSFKGCKVRELVSINCLECSRNYCLKHRHSADHDCNDSRTNSNDSRANNSDSARVQSAKPNTNDSNRNNSAANRGSSANKTSRSTRDYSKFGLVNGSASDRTKKDNAKSSQAGADGKSRNANGREFDPENIQGDLSEDEALARALQESMDNSARSTSNRSCRVS